MTPENVWKVQRGRVSGVWFAWLRFGGWTMELIPCGSWREAYDLADSRARS